MNSKISLCRTIFLFALFISGCDTPTMQPGSIETFSVLGQLHTDPGMDQMIGVYSTSNFGDKNIQDNFIKDAKVFVTDSLSYSSRFRYVSDMYLGKYYGNPKRVEFVPGRTYYLRVETASNTIFGETQFPEDFEITSHKNLDTLYIPEDENREIEIRWTKSKGSYGYFVQTDRTLLIENKGTVQDFGGGTAKYLDKANFCNIIMYKSAYGLGKIIKCEYLVTITAFDINYWAHRYDSNNSAGVKGAYGCFSSTVSKSVRLIIK